MEEVVDAHRFARFNLIHVQRQAFSAPRGCEAKQGASRIESYSVEAALLVLELSGLVCASGCCGVFEGRS